MPVNQQMTRDFARNRKIDYLYLQPSYIEAKKKFRLFSWIFYALDSCQHILWLKKTQNVVYAKLKLKSSKIY